MKSFGLGRYVLNGGVAVALLAGCGGSHVPVIGGAGADAALHSYTFKYTGKKQTFKVPRGVTRIRVIAVGGSGGGSVIARGGRVSAVIPVTPSETLAIYVGGAGTSSGGGFNGGGAGGETNYGANGNGGGGASDVREGGDALKDRVVVAGGGGAQGSFALHGYGKRYSGGGQGGARTGGSGNAGCCKKYGDEGGGGTGGTQSQGGSGGEGPEKQNPGESGQIGYGGAGGSGCGGSTCGYNGGDGGGGGGGFYGGGGGGGGVFEGCCGFGSGGGGGGGSSYAEPSASSVQMVRGAKDADGDGLVTLSWQ